MLTEPVECESCSAVSVNGGSIHCHQCLKDAIRIGFTYALDQYAIWKDGEQTIGCLNRNVKDVLNQFDKEEIAKDLIVYLKSQAMVAK